MQLLSKIWSELNKSPETAVAMSSEANFQKSFELQETQSYFSNHSNYLYVELASIEEFDWTPYKHILEIDDIQNFTQNINKLALHQLEGGKNIFNFKLSAIKKSYFESFCPWTGQILHSNISFVVNIIGMHNSIIAYRFDAKHVYYIFEGLYNGSKLFVYFPQIEIIIAIKTSGTSFASESFYIKSINILKSFFVAIWDDVLVYLKNSKPRQLVGITGIHNHPGHIFLNEYPSYIQLKKMNLLENFDKIIVEKNSFVPFNKLFPELTKDVIINTDFDSFQMFEYAVKNNMFIIRPTNQIFDLDIDVAQTTYAASFKSLTQESLTTITTAKDYFPIIWFEIKSSRRCWINQVEGILNIVNKLSVDFPKMAIVLAGWSLNNQVQSYDKRNFEGDNKIIKKIQSSINAKVKVFPIIGCQFYEKIAWAGVADIHITGWGSAPIFAAVSRKPIIVHANKYNCSTAYEYLMKHYPAIPYVKIIEDKYIKDESGCSSNANTNYNCKWESIYTEIIALLNKI